MHQKIYIYIYIYDEKYMKNVYFYVPYSENSLKHKIVLHWIFLMRIKPMQSVGFIRIQLIVGVLATTAYFIIYGQKLTKYSYTEIPLTTQGSQMPDGGGGKLPVKGRRCSTVLL